MFLAIYENLDEFKGAEGFVKGLLISVIAIVIVFAILLLISLSVNLLKLIANKGKKAEEKNKAADLEAVKPVEKAFSVDDIKDDDMMAAILVATVDFVSENKQDARVVSAKQIG